MSESTFNIEHGERSAPFGTLPAASVKALVSRGLAHFMNNEQASKVSAAKKKAEEKGEAFSDADAERIKGEAQATAWQSLIDGTVGTSVRGPRLSPIESAMRDVAELRIKARLVAAKLMVATAKDLPAKVTINGSEITRAELVKRQIARDEAGIRKEAEAMVKAAERAAAREAEKVQGAVAGGAVDMESLGL